MLWKKKPQSKAGQEFLIDLETASAQPTPAGVRPFIKKHWKPITAAVCAAAVAAAMLIPKGGAKQASASAQYVETSPEKRNIVNSYSADGTITAADTYTVKPMVKGTVLTADFEVGDTVSKGNVLYTIDSSDMASSVEKAQLSLEQAQSSYDDAVDAQYIRSSVRGTVAALKVKAGDIVTAGQEVAVVRDDSTLLLTLDFRFDTLEPARFGLIFLATAAIILARRWFLYFVVGYYFAYVLLLVAGCVRLAKDGAVSAALRRGKNLILFGLASVAAMVILLWPIVSQILTYNYAGRYSYYNGGGLALEAFYHIGRMGLFNILLMVLGLAFAAKHRAPFLPCLAGCELVVSILLFTRVQNTGSHQFLLFLPGYFLLFLLGAAALAEGIQRHRTLKLGCWAFVLMLSMSVRCSPLTTLAMPGFVIEHFPIQIPATRYFISLDKLIYDRKDIGQIQAIADWIDAHCDAGEISYMIPHDMLYNPDHFKNCRLPDAPINDKLAFGFSVPGTHNFPMQFFEAKYVITCDPFPQTYAGSGEMSIKLNERFLAAKDNAFTFEQSFDMGNGTTFTIWRRTAAPTRAEVEYYLSAFAAEDAQYPEMFSQVAEAWLTAHGL